MRGVECWVLALSEDFILLHSNKKLLPSLFILLAALQFNSLQAEEGTVEISYVEIEPVIVTNFLRPKGKKPGFVQLQAQITVHSTVAADAVEKHMPLIRDAIIDFLSFTDEVIIKDVTKRKQLREDLTAKVKETLEEVLGNAYAEDLVITHFMWG